VPVVDACDSGSVCCLDPTGVTAACVDDIGYGVICAASCTQNSDCESDCCATFASGSYCEAAQWCAGVDNPNCTVAPEDDCSQDSDCCPQSNGWASACSSFGGAAVCGSLCGQDSDCDSGCCTARDPDQLLVCAPASYCP
jgi:hypothetical protein